MMIKVNKEFTLLGLIEYIKKNGIANKVFLNKKGKVVVGDDGYLYMTDLNLTDTFTLEVEEEITEDTKVPRLIEMYEYEGNPNTHLYKNITIKGLLNYSQSDPLYVPKAFYILNDDMTMTLIWKDGELVE